MRTLFSAYPAGTAGVALLLLRGSIAMSLAAHIPGKVCHPCWVVLPIIALALAIGVGICTRAAAALSLMVVAWISVHGGSSADQVLPELIDAIALTLIGAGAFSIDSALFGRTIIKLPSCNRSCGC